MAAILKKAVLKTGDYHSRDGVVNVTPERRKAWAANFHRMRAANAHIPISWDHGKTEKELLPTEGDRTAANTVGELINVSHLNDGIELTLQLSDPKAIERAERNEIYVSPVIFEKWMHSNGETFEDCFTHVDLVNHPVDHSQGPFTTVAAKSVEPGHVACCLRMGLSTNVYTPKGVTRMSEEQHYYGDKDFIRNHDGSGGGKKRDKKSRSGRMKKKKRMSLMSFVRLSNTPSEEELKKLNKAGFIRLGDFPKDKDDDKEKDDAPEGEDSPLVDDPAPEKTKVEELTSGGDQEERDMTDDILDLLEELCNLVLPDDTTDENLTDRLRTALHTGVAMKNANDAKNAPEEEVDQPEEELQVANPGMQTMSLDQNAPSTKYITGIHRNQVAARLKQLLVDGKITPKEHHEKKAEIGVMRLSLSADGKPNGGDVEKWIESRKDVPKGTFFDTTQKLSLSTVEQPSIVSGGKQTPEQLAATVQYALSGGEPPAHLRR